MGTVKTTIQRLWRDNPLEYSPSSGLYEPEKAAIREELGDALDHVSVENLGAPNGLATLGPDGLLASDQIPLPISGEVYDTTAAGIAATVDGELFLVKGTGEVYATLYKNVAESAVSQEIDLASKAQWDALQADLEAAAAIVQVDELLPPELLLGIADASGNVGGFVVMSDGRMSTKSFSAGADGSIETSMFQVSDDGDPSVYFQDEVGNVALGINAGRVLAAGLSSSGSASDAPDVSPIVGDQLFMILGQKLPFYPGNVLAARHDPSPAMAAISSGSFTTEGPDQLIIDPVTCSTTGELTVRSTQDTSGTRFSLDLLMRRAPAGTGQTVPFLLIGDSITKGVVASDTVLAAHVKAALVSAGFVSQACGTILNTGDVAGNLHEGRASRDMDDYTGARITNMAPVTDDAAYIAGDAAYKAARNPFVVAVTGGDDIWGTGWAIDFAQYRTRFSIPDPKFIAIGLVTNSLIGVTVEDGIASILAGMDHWRDKIREDLPTALIAFYVTAVPRDPESDARHEERRAPALRAMIEQVRSYADARCVLLNVHGQMSTTAGWAAGDETTDDQTGVVTSTPTSDLDNIHPRTPAVVEAARVLAAAAAYATTGAA